MAEESTLSRLRQKREERMRLGQNTAEMYPVPSSEGSEDGVVRVAIVPLLEGEYDECLRASANLDVPENIAGATIVDRHERREVVCRALRETTDYSKRIFPNVETMMETLEPSDINFFYDAYVEMIQEISPRVDELTEEEIDFLKGTFGQMPWRDLSGRQVYALSRFLSLLGPEQLMGKTLGRLSTR